MNPSDLLTLASQLGALPALAVVACYLHAYARVRPLLVQAVALVRAVAHKVGVSADEEAREVRAAEVSTPDLGPLATGAAALLESAIANKLGAGSPNGATPGPAPPPPAPVGKAVP